MSCIRYVRERTDRIVALRLSC
ncbi:hypothetical protein MTBLM1_20417 [Rhodospirillaceae bacterium LM-1]|nr:hypothetical protein MTBLM1_20417 [Rhodospirillaceae bacterium LM-1]